MFRSKSKIIILLSVFLTLTTVLLKCMQFFNWYTAKSDTLQVVYLFSVSFISSIAIAFVFDYKRDNKSIMLYASYIIINFLYIFLNAELFLKDTKASFYITIASSVVYIALNTLLLLIKTSDNEGSDEKDSSDSKLKVLSTLNGFIILICLLAFWALVFAIRSKVDLIYVSICMVILFFTIFMLNIIKYRIVLSIIDIGYRRVVIFDSVCILLGMQLNYIFLNYIYTKGTPRVFAIIVFALSILPLSITGSKLDKAVLLSDEVEIDKSKTIVRRISNILLAAIFLLVIILDIFRIESDLSELAWYLFLMLTGILDIITAKNKRTKLQYIIVVAMSVIFVFSLVLTIMVMVQKYLT